MNIAILGNGFVGKNLGTLLAEASFSVYLGARSHEGEEYHSALQTVTMVEACKAADVVINALPWSVGGKRTALTVLESLPLEGKILVDLSNPLNADWSPLLLGEGKSAGLEISKALTKSHVVKAFNTIFADMMSSERIAALPVKPAGFYCGDNDAVKSQIRQILSKIGIDPIDTGDMGSAYYLEQMAHLNIRLALSQTQGTGAVFAYLR